MDKSRLEAFLLIEALAGNNRSGIRDSLNKLSQEVELSPRMQQLVQLLNEEQRVIEDYGSDTQADADNLQKMEAQLDELREDNAELEELRKMNDVLAAALGACRDCWGEVPECEACGGKGQSGSQRPDAALYHQFVAPAVSKVQRESQVAEHKRRQIK
jgi:hypothetical protein